MGELGDKPDYERLREARISENKARMEMLGLHRAKRELADIVAASAPPRRPSTHRQYAVGPPRRSARLNRHAVQHKMLPFAGCLGKVTAVPVRYSGKEEEEEDAAAAVDEEVAPAMQESHCDGEVRVAVDDPVLGVSCHFCSKLCGEEGCKRCVGGDLNLPCVGKTGCSSCHSLTGIICDACLKDSLKRSRQTGCVLAALRRRYQRVQDAQELRSVEEEEDRSRYRAFHQCNSERASVPVGCAPVMDKIAKQCDDDWLEFSHAH
ncbi:hypothetical protein ACP4OV_001726 [Aristida adscensionis]